jgi:hypothetical protein
MTPDEEVVARFTYLSAALAHREMLTLNRVRAPIPAVCRPLDDMPALPDELDIAVARETLRDVAERFAFESPPDANPGWVAVAAGTPADVLIAGAEMAAARAVASALERCLAVGRQLLAQHSPRPEEPK